KEEVNAVMEQARKAGAIITKAAQHTFWGGYAGYFQDPDGHLWEIVWNPQMKSKRIEPADLRLHPPAWPPRFHAFGSPTSHEQYDRGCHPPRAIQACGVFRVDRDGRRVPSGVRRL